MKRKKFKKLNGKFLQHIKKKNEIGTALVASKIFESFSRFDDDQNLDYANLAM